MILKPCSCGRTPALNEQTLSGIHVIRLECKCGKHGATLMFTKEADRDKMRQAAQDGWNLSD